MNKIIGQPTLRDEIAFYVEGYRENGIFPNCLLVAERGAGKGLFAAEVIGRQLKKPFHEMLAKDLKDSDAFFSHVVIPLLDGKEATIFIDEASLLTPNLTHTFLKVLEPRDGNMTRYKWNKTGQTFTFDFTKLTFVFATTNPQKVDPDLKDRLKILTFDPYTIQDLSQIVKEYAHGVRFADGVLEEIAETVRNNPRNAFERAQDILRYTATHHRKTFNPADLKELNRRLHILPLGLNKLEAQALKFVSDGGKTSLTTLAAKMRLTSEAVRRDVETRLLATGLIEVEARGRTVTQKGREILEQIEALNKKRK